MVRAPIRPRPCGPINTPDRIKPIIPGILSLLRIIGDKRMIKSSIEKTNTGFFSGS
jgi:hypothetical protein